MNPSADPTPAGRDARVAAPQPLEQEASVRPSISLVMAACNEGRTLEAVFQRCLAVLRECAADFEIIILDDGSTDDTGAVAERLRRQHPQVLRVLRHERNLGIARTFEDLYRAAAKQFIFDVPADGEYPPEALRQIAPMLAQYDVVVCNRMHKNYTPYRQIISHLYRRLPRWLFGVELYDPGSIKVRRRELIDQIAVTSTGVFVEAERLLRAARRGYRIGKVDIEPELRQGGRPQGAKLTNVAGAARDLAWLWIQLIVLRRAP